MANLRNFIDSIHGPHLDNAQRLYVAEPMGGRGTRSDVSPATNFIFEFFLFNSLYSVDWESSDSTDCVVHHSREMSESAMQRKLLAFCRNRCREGNEDILNQAFLPLAGWGDLNAAWTEITPDDRITAEDGRAFFTRVTSLGESALNADLTASRSTFESIQSCCYFVYLVRNNIFHGSKSLGEIYDENQSRRIGVYDLFLRCLNSLFFLAWGYGDVGSVHAQFPMEYEKDGPDIGFGLQQVYSLVSKRLLKPEDSWLFWRLFRNNADTLELQSHDRRALFYPSSGDDLLFPLLIGMPYCTDFYFYDVRNRSHFRSQSRMSPTITKMRRYLVGTGEITPVETDDGHCYEFQCNSATRRIWIMPEDNMTFLDLDVPVTFYFHRGDSPGEGGSGQKWDSDLLPSVLVKATPGIGCHIITDGEPGGLAEDVKKQLERVSLANSHRGRDYYYGIVHASS